MTPRPTDLPRVAAHTYSRAVGDDIVVINDLDKTAHSLTGSSAAVWRALEAQTPLADDAATRQALAELTALGLLDAPADTDFGRRALLKGAAVVGAATVATIALPTAAAALSDNDLSIVLSAPATATQGNAFTVTADIASAAAPADTAALGGTLTLTQLTPTPQATEASQQVTVAPPTQRTFSVTEAATGTYTYQATYTGDPFYNNATSNTITVNVSVVPSTGVATTTAIGTVDTQKNKTYNVIVTVTVSSGTFGPVGSVTLTSSNANATVNPQATQTLPVAGTGTSRQLTFSVTNGASGSVTLTATFTPTNPAGQQSSTGTKTYAITTGNGSA